MTPTRSLAGSAPRTLRKPQAKLRAAVKISPTVPRAARREAVRLDGHPQRGYTNHPGPASTPRIGLINPGRSIKESETPQRPIEPVQVHLLDRAKHRPHKVILRQPIPQRRRQQHHLPTVTRNEVLTHPRMVINCPDGTR